MKPIKQLINEEIGEILLLQWSLYINNTFWVGKTYPVLSIFGRVN